jgi:hypothetical protein
MAKQTRKVSSKDTQVHKSQDASAVIVTTVHKPITNLSEASEFLAALAKAPSGVRFKQRLRSEDGSKEIHLWEAPSLGVMTKYIGRLFPSGGITGIVGHAGPLLPQITQVFLLSDITPGGTVIVGGRNFGTYNASKSQFLLVGGIQSGQTGAFPSSGISVGGYPALKLQIFEDGSKFEWGDTYAAGQIVPGPPNGISGVLDQPANLQIVAADGKASNLSPVQFRATRGAPTPIPGSAFKVVSCAGGGTCYTNITDESVGGFHGGGFVNFGGSGTDQYSCQLLNQFTYDHYEWGIEDGINGGPFGGNPEPVGLPNINLEVSWFYNGGLETSSLYSLSVFAVGPVGLNGW